MSAAGSGTLTGVLRDLLAESGVDEVCELRSRFGFMALHGGSLEQVTDVVAIEAAEGSGASVYAILQPAGFRWHVPAINMDPAESPALQAFLDHVEVVVSVHGFGIDSLWSRPRTNGVDPPALGQALLLGGGNRELASTMADALTLALPGYTIVRDLDAIPARLRGLHPANPVNLPAGGGVQLELCPSVRGLGMAWRHLPPGERPPETFALIDALVMSAGDAG